MASFKNITTFTVQKLLTGSVSFIFYSDTLKADLRTEVQEFPAVKCVWVKCTAQFPSRPIGHTVKSESEMCDL